MWKMELGQNVSFQLHLWLKEHNHVYLIMRLIPWLEDNHWLAAGWLNNQSIFFLHSRGRP
jgi:hypothetical protein